MRVYGLQGASASKCNTRKRLKSLLELQNCISTVITRNLNSSRSAGSRVDTGNNPVFWWDRAVLSHLELWLSTVSTACPHVSHQRLNSSPCIWGVYMNNCPSKNEPAELRSFPFYWLSSPSASSPIAAQTAQTEQCRQPFVPLSPVKAGSAEAAPLALARLITQNFTINKFSDIF